MYNQSKRRKCHRNENNQGEKNRCRVQPPIIDRSKYISTYIKSEWTEGPVKNKKTFRLDKNISMRYTLHCLAKAHQKNKDIKRLNIKGWQNIHCANTNQKMTGTAGLMTKFKARRVPR